MARACCALETEYNDWTNWTLLFDSAFALMTQAKQQEGSAGEGEGHGDDRDTLRRKTVNHLVEVCLRAKQLADIASTNPAEKDLTMRKRGPLLARLELMVVIFDTLMSITN